MLDAPHTAALLRHTKDALDRWARARNLVIIDAGQAERYGCAVPEFVDEHHALPQCYARIFGTLLAGSAHARKDTRRVVERENE